MKQPHRPNNIKAEKRLGIKTVIIRILLVLIAFLLVLSLVVYCFVISKLNKLNRTSMPTHTETSTTATVETDAEISAPSPSEEDEDEDEEEANKAMQEAIKALEEMEAIAATGDIFADSDVFNVLLIGTDERTSEFSTNARGDACLLLSLNKTDASVHLISFERGMGVPILSGEYEGQYDWLTHTFRYGGADLMMEEIQECFKVGVTHYVRVNLDTFIDGINAVGGVDIELTQAEADYINKSKSETKHVYEVTPGLNHLNGETALVYARCRKIDSDWSRIGRQRTVIQAAVDQVKEMNVFELNDLMDTLLPLVQTNLTNGEIISLVLSAPKFIGQTMVQDTIPIAGTYGGMTGMGGRSLYAVDFETNAQYLHEILYGEDE